MQPLDRKLERLDQVDSGEAVRATRIAEELAIETIQELGVLARVRGDGTWEHLYDTWLRDLGPSPGPPEARYQD